MEIANPNVTRFRHRDGVRKWFIATDDAIAVIIGNGYVFGLDNFQRQRLSAFPTLLLGLKCQQIPVLHAKEADFITHVMFT
jgi:hypothetical protein